MTAIPEEKFRGARRLIALIGKVHILQMDGG